jgi:hypothetical protein
VREPENNQMQLTRPAVAPLHGRLAADRVLGKRDRDAGVPLGCYRMRRRA